MGDFDFVIVGGGSAGCVLASRLSENPNVKVCLLEAGGRGDHWLIRFPMGVAVVVPKPVFNWAFNSTPQKGLNGRKSYHACGKTLGGTSAINAMVYIRGHRSDYDNWESLGNKGWSYRDVMPYFIRSENNQEIKNEYHGQNGPQYVSNGRNPGEVKAAFIKACEETGVPFNPDFNGREQEGAGEFQLTQLRGERWSTARSYLHPVMHRPNLKVVTNAQVNKVILEGKKAIGVECNINGQVTKIMAKREVILSAGAYVSPKILMLSGIGDSNHLREKGIPVVHELSSVGRNMHDHPNFYFIYKSNSLSTLGFSFGGILRIIKEMFQYRKDRSGLVSSNGPEAGAFLKTDPQLKAPDFQLHFFPAVVEDHLRKMHFSHGYSVNVCLLRPKGRGQILLESSDPNAAPLIDSNFLGENEDLETFVRAFKFVRKIMEAKALNPFRKMALFLDGVQTDDQIRQYLRRRVCTTFHASGTCRMGNDETAVVDSQLRVRGMTGLRVVDASIMPTPLGGNSNAPVIMIAEKASDMILAENGFA